MQTTHGVPSNRTAVVQRVHARPQRRLRQRGAQRRIPAPRKGTARRRPYSARRRRGTLVLRNPSKGLLRGLGGGLRLRRLLRERQHVVQHCSWTAVGVG